MKKSIFSLGLAFTMILSCNFLSAQETISFNNPIQELKVEPLTGNVLVKTKDGISSVNPTTNNIDWSLDIKKVNNQTKLNDLAKAYDAISNNDFLKAFSSDADIEFIADSPYVQIKFDNNSVIVNNTTGEVVFNAAEYGYILYSTTIILSQNQLLILGQKDNEINFINFDLSTHKNNWVSKVGNLDTLKESFNNFLKSF